MEEQEEFESPEEELTYLYRQQMRNTAARVKERMRQNNPEGQSNSYFIISTKMNIDSSETIPDNAFPYMTAASELKIPEAKYIGNFAFTGAMGLEEIDLPEAIQVGNSSFRFCSSAKKIDAPKLVTIGDNAFEGCEAATEIKIPKAKTIGDEAFYGGSSFENISLPRVESIGNGAFQNCTSLKTMILPRLHTIGEKAFKNCTSLKHLEIMSDTDSEIRTFNPNTIEGCRNLESVDLFSVDELDGETFKDCRNLKYIGLQNIYQLPEDIFSNLVNLKCIVLSSMTWTDVNTIKDDIGIDRDWNLCLICRNQEIIVQHEQEPVDWFNYDLEHEDQKIIVSLKDRYKQQTDLYDIYSEQISSDVFKDNDFIETVTFGYVDKINTQAFNNCKNLKIARFPWVENNDNIRNNIFVNCPSLKCVTFPSLSLIQDVDVFAAAKGIPTGCIVTFKNATCVVGSP